MSRFMWGRILIMAFSLALCNLSYAEGYTETQASNAVKENPSALAMAVDLVAVRPVMFTVTVAGSALWLVSLPFSAAGGNAMKAADTLVVGPAMTTFVRCLGCTKNGYAK